MPSRKPFQTVLTDCGYNNTSIREFVLDVFRRLTVPNPNDEASFFATSFLTEADATQVFTHIQQAMEHIPHVDEWVLLPPLNLIAALGSTTILRFDDTFCLVLVGEFGVVIPVCTIAKTSAGMLDTLVSLYGASCSHTVTLDNIGESVLQHL